MWAVKNINCAPWPGMQLYQNNAAFVLYAVGIKWETERQILLREQVLSEPRVRFHVFWSCFPTLSGLLLQIQLSLKVLWAPFRANNVWLLRVLLLPQTLFVHSPAHKHIFRCNNGKWFQYLSWPLWVTFFIPLFSPSVKWEISLAIKCLSPLARRLAEAE